MRRCFVTFAACTAIACGPAPDAEAPLVSVQHFDDSSAPAAPPATSPRTPEPPKTPPPQERPAPAPPPPDPTTDDDPEVEERGPLTDTQRSVMKAVAVCLDKSQAKGESSAGSLFVELTVDGAGAVTDVDLGPGYPPSARACVEPRLKAIRFPAQTNAGIRVLKYPINEALED